MAGMTRDRVSRLLDRGESITVIAERLGLAKSTVSYHARRLGYAPDDRFAVRYDWAAISARYEAGATLSECRDEFGFSVSAWAEAVHRGAVVPRPRARGLESYVKEGKATGRRGLKRRLLAEGQLGNACARCGTNEWRGRRLSLALHHINGNNGDHRLDNLLLLCPNCHSQTENYGGRNARRRSSG